MQEPASAVASALNGIFYLIALRKFTQEVPREAPLYALWIVNGAVNVNCWFWSTVYHARDKPLTEVYLNFYPINDDL